MARVGLILKILAFSILLVPIQGRKRTLKTKTFDLKATTTKASIKSPNYPYKYYRYLKYTWNIEAPKGMIIELNLNDMFIEEGTDDCNYDYLEIYDGKTTRMARLCGEEHNSQIFTTTQPSAVVIFYSDEIITDYGFKLVFKAIKIVVTTTTTTSLPTTTSNSKPSTVTSSDTTYADLKVTSTGRTTVQTSTTTAKATTTSTFTTTGKITTAVEKATEQIAISTTTEQPTSSTTEQSTSATAEQSMKQVVLHNGKIIAIPTCSSAYSVHHLLVASENKQVFTSQGYPSNYPSNLKEEWLIVKPNTTVPLAIVVLDSDLEESNGCEYDFVAIFDDACPTKSAGSFCGKKQPSFTLSGGQFALARISTDHSDHHRGVKIQYFLGKAPEDPAGEETDTLRDVLIGITVAIVSFMILFAAVRCFIVFKRKRTKAQKRQRGARASGSRIRDMISTRSGRGESRNVEMNTVSYRSDMRIRNNPRRNSTTPQFTELMVGPPSYSALFTETAFSHQTPQSSSGYSLEPGKVPLYDEPSCNPPPYSVKVMQPTPVEEMPPPVAYRTRSRTRNSRNARSQGHSSSGHNPPNYSASVINVEPSANIRDILSPPPAYDDIQQNRNLRTHRMQ